MSEELSPVEQQRADMTTAMEQQESASEPAQDAPNSEAAAEIPTEVDSGGEVDPEQKEADKALTRGKNYYARKIDALTREREQAREAAAQAMRVAEQMAQRNAPQQAQPQAQAPQREQFQDYESYLEARAEFKAAQATQAMQAQFFQRLQQMGAQNAQQSHAQQIATQFQSKLAEGTKAYNDWEDVVGASDVQIGQAAGAIAQADNPAGVMYWLAKNPQVAQRIGTLDPIRAAIEVGRIDAGLKSAPTVSNAPKPGKPANARGGSSGGYRDDMSQDEFNAMRRKR